MAVDFRALIEFRPNLRIFDEQVVGGAELAKVLPPVHSALDEPGCLYQFEYTIVVEVLEPGVPAPRTVRHPKSVPAVHPGRNAFGHLIHLPGADPQEMALRHPEGRRDVADEHVENAIAVDVAEV